jgi:hypothetical protein
VTLTVDNSRVELQSVRPIAEHGSPPMAQSLAAVSQPHFLDLSGRSIGMWFEALGQSEYLNCNTITGRCTDGPNYGTTQANQGTFLSNPSRP